MQTSINNQVKTPQAGLLPLLPSGEYRKAFNRVGAPLGALRNFYNR